MLGADPHMGSPADIGAACAGGQVASPGIQQPPGRVLRLREAGLVTQEDSTPAAEPTSGATCSSSARPSQSPGLSEAGGEEHAVQGQNHTEAGQGTSARKRGKRKLPVPDLDAIADVAERRRQKRLVKNRNTAAASRVRKALELDELSQRMRSLEQDNASLHSHVDSRNVEIAHLRTLIQGLHSPSGHCLPALPPPDNPPPFVGPPNPDEDARGEPSIQHQAIHPDHPAASIAQSHKLEHGLGGPADIWADPLNVSGRDFCQQQQTSLPPINLEAPLPEDQFAERFMYPLGPGRMVPARHRRAAPMASSATSSLSASEQTALASADDWQRSVPSVERPQQARHMRGGTADAGPQPSQRDPGTAGWSPHADFLAFPWQDMMEIVNERQQPRNGAHNRQQ